MNPEIEIADIIIENFCRNMLEFNSGKYTDKDFYEKVKSIYEKYDIQKINDYGLQIYIIDTLMWYSEMVVPYWLAQFFKIDDDSKLIDMIDKMNEESTTHLLDYFRVMRNKNDFLDFQEFYYDQKDYEIRLNATRDLYEVCIYKSLMQKAKEGVLK